MLLGRQGLSLGSQRAQRADDLGAGLGGSDAFCDSAEAISARAVVGRASGAWSLSRNASGGRVRAKTIVAIASPGCDQHPTEAQDDHKLIAHNYGAVMAVSAEPDGYLNTVEDLGFFKSDRTDIRIFQTQHTPPGVR